ncbi:MAG: DUF6163 family protein [Pseudomonadota bacterium]
MSIVLDTVQPITKAGRAERIYLVFVRLVSVLCLVATVGYWAGLSGISDFFGVAALGSSNTSLSAMNVSLAALFPVAMLGLWLRARWGVAIWVGILVAQILAHGGAPSIFEAKPSLIVTNLGLLAALALICGYMIYSRYIVAEAMTR